MGNVHNLEWLNLNSERNYPIKENATRKDTTGSVELPNQLIVDAVFVTDVNNSFYVKTVQFLDISTIISIYDQNDVFVGTVTIMKDTHTTYESYQVDGHGIYKYLQGKLVIGDLSNIEILGTYEFVFDATKFEDTVIIPNIRGVTSISVVGKNTLLIGDVQLVAGYNCRLRIDEAENKIYIDAISGEGLGPVCNCDEEPLELVGIKTINGIRPRTSDGNFDIRGVGCIEVAGLSNGIEIRNTCEEPCCDCDDVNALLASLSDKQTQLTDLDRRVLVLEHA